MNGGFERGKIYKLVSKMTTEIYVGSTTQSLNQRLLKHKSDYKRYLKKKGNYMTSFELLQHEDVDIELIEDYPCASKNELEAREGEWIKELKQYQIVCVNKVLPGQKKGGSYQNGKIYRLFSELTDKIYIGATIQTLNIRLSIHKTAYKRFLNQKGYYMTSFELVHYEDVRIELIENYPCASRKELESREGVVVKDNQEICVNKVFPGRTQKEYYEDHKDKIKEYYEGNKDKIKEQHVKYYEGNRDKIKEQQAKYYEGNKDKIKEQQAKYYEGNKDKIKEQQAKNKKKYYEKRREKIREQQAKYYKDNKKRNAKLFHCECGSTVRTGSRAKHLKTKKHKDFISIQFIN